MRSQVAFYWLAATVIFLLVLGTLVTTSIALASTDPAKTSSFLTSGVVLASLSVVAIIATFIYHTAATYKDGNWLHSVVDHSKAAKQRLRKEWADASALLQRMKSDLSDLQQANRAPSAKQAQINLANAQADALKFIDEQTKKTDSAARAADIKTIV